MEGLTDPVGWTWAKMNLSSFRHKMTLSPTLILRVAPISGGAAATAESVVVPSEAEAGICSATAASISIV
jgi:hypothetical protein